jgi:hypothetical protein
MDLKKIKDLESLIEKKNRNKDKIRPTMRRSQNFNEAILLLCGRFAINGKLNIPSGTKEFAYDLNISIQGTKEILFKMERFGLIEKRKIEKAINQEAYFPIKDGSRMIIMDYIEEALINQRVEIKMKHELIEIYKEKQKGDAE